ncbi:uncharacterized protein N7482_010619 [Penicillium canariense]|uniref:Uncharacterized protein n=1 Tax=Penicillium canariense TaxID=189055 RepID=A0A9W9HL02_9EURO|nr:uncharacterized protein N7482_010619 [Penicillium canariense]KAJ5151367.1 hypothetical protein N7482_010619 [Penicillium canariense]
MSRTDTPEFDWSANADQMKVAYYAAFRRNDSSSSTEQHNTETYISSARGWDEFKAMSVPDLLHLDETSILRFRKTNSGHGCSNLHDTDFSRTGHIRSSRMPTGKPPAAKMYGVLWLFFIDNTALIGEDLAQRMPWQFGTGRPTSDKESGTSIITIGRVTAPPDMTEDDFDVIETVSFDDGAMRHNDDWSKMEAKYNTRTQMRSSVDAICIVPPPANDSSGVQFMRICGLPTFELGADPRLLNANRLMGPASTPQQPATTPQQPPIMPQAPPAEPVVLQLRLRLTLHEPTITSEQPSDTQALIDTTQRVISTTMEQTVETPIILTNTTQIPIILPTDDALRADTPEVRVKRELTKRVHNDITQTPSRNWTIQPSEASSVAMASLLRNTMSAADQSMLHYLQQCLVAHSLLHRTLHQKGANSPETTAAAMQSAEVCVTFQEFAKQCNLCYMSMEQRATENHRAAAIIQDTLWKLQFPGRAVRPELRSSVITDMATFLLSDEKNIPLRAVGFLQKDSEDNY